jgi:hypothetical protein
MELGQLLAEVERGAGPGRGKKVSAELTSFRQFIEQLGLDRQTALEAQRIGKMPEEEHLLDAQSRSEPLRFHGGTLPVHILVVCAPPSLRQ